MTALPQPGCWPPNPKPTLPSYCTRSAIYRPVVHTVCFPGIFYWGGAEKKIRQYLVDNNYVESVISLALNLFYGTTIAVTILVLSKHKPTLPPSLLMPAAAAYFKKKQIPTY